MTGLKQNKYLETRKITYKMLFYIVSMEYFFHTLIPVISSFYFFVSGKYFFILLIVLPLMSKLYFEIENKQNRIYL